MPRHLPTLCAMTNWRTRAVVARNMRVYLKNWKSAFVPPLIEPIVMFLVFGMGLGAYMGKISYEGREVGYLEYVAPGIVTYTFFSTAFFESLYGSFVRMFYQKTFEAILGTPVERAHIIWGEILWGAIRAAMYAVCVSIVLICFWAAGIVKIYPAAFLFLIPFGMVASMSFSAFALLFTAKVPTIDHMNYPVFLIGIPLSLVSNTYFPADRIHPWAAAAAMLNPLYHFSEITRHLLLGGGPEWWMLRSAAVIATVGSVIVAVAHRWMNRRLEKEA